MKRTTRGVPWCLVLTAHQRQLGAQRPQKPGGSRPPVTSNHREGVLKLPANSSEVQPALRARGLSREARDGVGQGDHIPSSDWPSVSPDHTRPAPPGGFLSCRILSTCAVPAILWALEKRPSRETDITTGPAPQHTRGSAWGHLWGCLSEVAITNHHLGWGSEQQKLVLLWFWRPEVRDQGVSRAVLPPQAERIRLCLIQLLAAPGHPWLAAASPQPPPPLFLSASSLSLPFS